MQNIFQFMSKLLLMLLALCLPVFIVDSVTSFNLSLLWLPLIVSSGLTLGILIGGFRRISLLHAARHIDMMAALKDRAVSALEFITRGPKNVMTALQIENTFGKLEGMPPRQVVRFSLPREAKYCVILAIALIALSQAEFFAPEAESGEIDTTPQITVEAARLLLESREMKEEAEKQQDEEMKKLAEELEKKVLELNQPDISKKEAMLKLSELSKMIKKNMEKMELAKMEHLLKSVGQQFNANPMLGDLGYLLQRGEFELSARKLEKLADKLKELEDEQKQNLADELKQTQKSLAGTTLDSLGDDMGAAGDSLGGGDIAGAEGGLKRAGKRLRNIGRGKSKQLRLSRLLQQLTMGKMSIAKGRAGKPMDLYAFLQGCECCEEGKG